MQRHNVIIRLGFLWTISVYFVYTVHGICSRLDSQYPCLKWSQCQRGKKEILHQMTLQQCWDQCRLRPRCNAVQYWRGKRLCNIIYSQNGTLIPASFGSCVRITQDSPVPASCSGCPMYTTCDTSLGTCTMQACYPLSIVNATVYGNMYAVGSSLKVVRDESPTTSIYPVCQPNGLWALILHRNTGNSASPTQTLMLYNTPHEQQDATAACTDAGQSLVRLDPQKYNDVKDFLLSTPEYNGVQFWVQGKCVTGDGQWLFDNGDIFNYTVFPYNDMNGGAGEPCVRLVNYSVNDKNCDDNFGFICETT